MQFAKPCKTRRRFFRWVSLLSLLLLNACRISSPLGSEHGVRRFYGADDVVRAQGYYYHDTLYFSELLFGTPRHPYDRRAGLRLLIDERDTVRLDSVSVDWIAQQFPELFLTPAHDSVYYERFPFRHKVVTRVGVKPRRFLGWDTDSVRVFSDDCRGIALLTLADRLVAVYIKPTQRGMPGWEERSAPIRQRCEPLGIPPLRVSSVSRNPFLPLPLTEEEFVFLFGPPQRVESDFEMRVLY